MANRRGKWKSGSSDRFPFLGSKITADGDCSHEIRRQLLLGRKAMRNLYVGQEATVRTIRGTTDWFKIGKGV